MCSMLAKGCGNNSLFIILVLLAVFGAIVGGVILIRKYVKPFQSDDKPLSPEETAKEEVNRLLQDVEDETTAEQIQNFKAEVREEDKEGEDKPILK